MIINSKYTIVTLIVAILCACTPQRRVAIEEFSAPRYTPKYAHGFEIKTLPDSTATLIQLSKQRLGEGEKDDNILILDPNTLPPKNFEGVALQAHARRIVSLSRTNIAMLDAIGMSELIIGISKIDESYNTTIIESYNRGRTLDITDSSGVNYQAITALQPDLILLNELDEQSLDIASRLEELGIQYLYIREYAEESPLARAEWMVAMGEICGVRDGSIEIFENIDTQYTAQRDSMQIYLQDTLSKRPLVMVNNPNQGHRQSSANFIAQLINDAGGEYLPLEVDSLQVDIYINIDSPTQTLDTLKQQSPISSEANNITTAEFWESRPDIALSDLIKILHPSNI